MAMKKVIVVNPDNNFTEVSVATQDGIDILRRITKALEPLSSDLDGYGRVKVTIAGGAVDTVTTISTVTTVTTVTTVSTVSSVTNFGIMPAEELVYYASKTAYATAVRSNISFP